MNLIELDAKISPLHERLSASLYFGRKYNHRPQWQVKLELSERREGKLEVEGSGATLTEALAQAWERLEKLAFCGFGKQALTPALEHHPRQADKGQIMNGPDDEEIPF